MNEEYSSDVYYELVDKFKEASLHRPLRVGRFETGAELEYDITGVYPVNEGRVRLKIEKFVGGGFAGQVYRVKILDINSGNGSIGGLEAGKFYAMKILIPPSGFSLLFRNVMYWIGFQGPFQLQVNPSAARSAAYWQKFIRRGAKIRFGDEKTVCNNHATFIDNTLGSLGELSEWVEGRTWQLEVDERLDLLSRWRKGKHVDTSELGSPEYRAKKEFMRDFVELLHEMGGHEFARQYEWTTCKSQPNCLKRLENDDSPSDGLTAVDFKAGLALLPFLPMSPGDFKLILKGLARGSLVQFDLGNIKKLEKYIEEHNEEFADLKPMLNRLKEEDGIYRDSIPDITHNHFRLLFSPKLWSTMFSSFITGWKVRNYISGGCEGQLRRNKFLVIIFYLLGAIPVVGTFCRRLWGHKYWRKHYGGILTSPSYFRRAIRGKIIEKLIKWYRAERIDKERARRIVKQPWRSIPHIPLSFLPVGIHRILTDFQYLKARFDFLLIRPVRLYFNSELREEWLLDMIAEGKRKRLLSEEDSQTILSQVKEPFIQKYLKSLAVHVCTLPVTQVVSLIVAGAYILLHPEMPWKESFAIGFGILVLFQVVPISPGSLVRGLYVVYLVVKERNFKDYNIAVYLGFFKYIGYLAFPIQMAHRYPAMARFMAGHWATEAVHIVPVFGESGALLEHSIFNLFYNRPLTLRRRMRKKAEFRVNLKPRYWHIVFYALIGAGIFGIGDYVNIGKYGELPGLKQIWYLTILVPFLCGAFVTVGAGGASLMKRVFSGVVCGILTGIFYTAITAYLGRDGLIDIAGLINNGMWRIFIFAVISTIGVILTEIKLPEPKV